MFEQWFFVICSAVSFTAKCWRISLDTVAHKSSKWCGMFPPLMRELFLSTTDKCARRRQQISCMNQPDELANSGSKLADIWWRAEDERLWWILRMNNTVSNFPPKKFSFMVLFFYYKLCICKKKVYFKRIISLFGSTEHSYLTVVPAKGESN